jgi:hypothetical protein
LHHMASAAKAAAKAEAAAAELKRKGNMIMREDLTTIMNVGHKQDPKWAKAVAITCIDFVEWTAKLQTHISGNKFKTHDFEPLEEEEQNEALDWRRYLHGVVAFKLEGRAHEKCDFLFHQYLNKFHEHRHDEAIAECKRRVNSTKTEIEKMKKGVKAVRAKLSEYLEDDPTDSAGEQKNRFGPEIKLKLKEIDAKKAELGEAIEALRETSLLATENRYLSKAEAMYIIRTHNFIEKHEGITVEQLEAKAEERLAEGGYGDVMVEEAQTALDGAESRVMGLVPRLEAAREREALAKEALAEDHPRLAQAADGLAAELRDAEAELATKARLLEEARVLEGFLTLEEFTRLVCGGPDELLKDHIEINFHVIWEDLEKQMAREKKEHLRRAVPKHMQKKRGLF